MVLAFASLFSGVVGGCGILGLEDNRPPPTESTVNSLSYTLSAGDAVCTPFAGFDTTSRCMRPDVKGVLSARNVGDSTIHAFYPSGSSGTAFVLSLYRDGDWNRPVAGYNPNKDYGDGCLAGDFFVPVQPGERAEVTGHLADWMSVSGDTPSLAPGTYRLVAEFPNPLCHPPGPSVRVVAPAPVTVGVSRPFHMSSVNFAPALGVDLSKMTYLGDQLYVQTLQAGDGDTAAVSGDSLIMNEVEWLPDGTQLFSTYDKARPPRRLLLGDTTRLEPFARPVAGMVRGEIRRILVPPALGDGARGFGRIPPNSVLIWDVELLKIQPPS